MNLWAEFDNQHSTEAARYKQARHRLPEQVVLSSLRDWLLQDYVTSYCRSLAETRIYRRCYWIDALGVRTAENTLPPALQSLVSVSEALAQQSRPIALYGLVLESGSSRRREGKVSQNGTPTPAKHISIPKEGGLVHASWLEAAPQLLSVLDQSPAIFLLNPFGQTVFSYDDLAPLYSRTPPTELCLLISHKQLETRFVPLLDTPDGATALTALLRTDRWKALISKSREQAESSNTGKNLQPSLHSPYRSQATDSPIDGIIDLLLASMQRHFLSVQRIALTMQARPAVVETVPYTLLFATRRQDSLASMNDAVCLYRRRLNEQSSRGILLEDWLVGQEQERFAEEIGQLYERTLAQGRTQRVRRWPDLRQQLLLTNFGQFTLQDYDQVMSRLLANGEVRCEWRRRTTANQEHEVNSLPGNEDMLIWM